MGFLAIGAALQGGKAFLDKTGIGKKVKNGVSGFFAKQKAKKTEKFSGLSQKLSGVSTQIPRANISSNNGGAFGTGGHESKGASPLNIASITQSPVAIFIVIGLVGLYLISKK